MAEKYKATRLTSNAANQVATAGTNGTSSLPSAEGVLHTIVIEGADSGTITVADVVGSTSTTLAAVTVPANMAPASLVLDAEFVGVLTVTLAGFASPNVCITWK